MTPLDTATTGARFLAGIVDGKGKFRYRFDAESQRDASGYNILRHAGSVWAICDVYHEIPIAEIRASSARAATFLLNEYLRFPEDLHSACIVEEDKIKLGGNALAVLAFIGVAGLTDDPLLIDLSSRLASYITSNRGEDGDFLHKRYYSSGKRSAFRSMYYTGEALLALLELHAVSEDSTWLRDVLEVEARLAESSYGAKEQSHWMLYALDRLVHFETDKVFFHHAAAIVENILDVPDYLSWERSTPIACRTEGLLAFLRMSDTLGVSRKGRLQRRCFDRVETNLELQLQFRRPDGSFVRGGHDRRKSEVRIDYVQHNVSAFLHYHRYVSGEY